MATFSFLFACFFRGAFLVRCRWSFCRFLVLFFTPVSFLFVLFFVQFVLISFMFVWGKVAGRLLLREIGAPYPAHRLDLGETELQSMKISQHKNSA